MLFSDSPQRAHRSVSSRLGMVWGTRCSVRRETPRPRSWGWAPRISPRTRDIRPCHRQGHLSPAFSSHRWRGRPAWTALPRGGAARCGQRRRLGCNRTAAVPYNGVWARFRRIAMIGLIALMRAPQWAAMGSDRGWADAGHQHMDRGAGEAVRPVRLSHRLPGGDGGEHRLPGAGAAGRDTSAPGRVLCAAGDAEPGAGDPVRLARHGGGLFPGLPAGALPALTAGGTLGREPARPAHAAGGAAAPGAGVPGEARRQGHPALAYGGACALVRGADGRGDAHALPALPGVRACGGAALEHRLQPAGLLPGRAARAHPNAHRAVGLGGAGAGGGAVPDLALWAATPARAVPRAGAATGAYAPAAAQAEGAGGDPSVSGGSHLDNTRPRDACVAPTSHER